MNGLEVIYNLQTQITAKEELLQEALTVLKWNLENARVEDKFQTHFFNTNQNLINQIEQELNPDIVNNDDLPF